MLRNTWRGNRFAGDEEGFELLDAWYHRDRHLWQWQEHQRQKSIGRRRDQYKRIAHELSTRDDTLVIEAFDKSATQRHEEVESEDQEIKLARRQQKEAATSELCSALISAFGSRGGRIVKVNPALTTQQCHVCGCGYDPADRWDAAPSVMHTCAGCGRTWDQDENGARNVRAVWEREGGKEVITSKQEAKWRGRKRRKVERQLAGAASGAERQLEP